MLWKNIPMLYSITPVVYFIVHLYLTSLTQARLSQQTQCMCVFFQTLLQWLLFFDSFAGLLYVSCILHLSSPSPTFTTFKGNQTFIKLLHACVIRTEQGSYFYAPALTTPMTRAWFAWKCLSILVFTYTVRSFSDNRSKAIGLRICLSLTEVLPTTLALLAIYSSTAFGPV